MKIQEIINEGPELSSTLSQICALVGNPVTQMYNRAEQILRKTFADNGNINGSQFIIGSAMARWMSEYYEQRLETFLYDLVRLLPQNKAKMSLQRWLRSVIPTKLKFTQLSNDLPDLLIEIGEAMNYDRFINLAEKWEREQNSYLSLIAELNDLENKRSGKNTKDKKVLPLSSRELAAHNEREAESNKIHASQHNSAMAAVNAVLNALPSSVAGDIRPIVARAGNKLLALKVELEKRGYTV